MHSTLRSIFEQALKLTLASPLLLSCGPGVDTRPYDLPVCDMGSLALSGLTPAQPVDYTELRRVSMFGAPERNESKVTSFGTQCGTAANKAACDAAVMSFKSTSGFGRDCLQICTDEYLLTTRGDTLASVETIEALKAFLGTIDTPQEALLMASANSYSISCTDKMRGAVRKTANGFEVLATTGIACGPGTSIKQHVLAVDAQGNVNEVSQSVLENGDPNCAVGRRPCGLRAARRLHVRDALAAHFAVCAHLEAASVPAFVRMQRELHAHGSPAQLQLQAALAVADEIRHTVTTTRLARRFGAEPEVPSVERHPLRGLHAVALDNAVEGCVRETFGALVAHRQAARAKDADIAREHSTIAADETRHAALSWDVERWTSSRLTRRERHATVTARRAAVEKLRHEVATPVDPALVEQAGMPAADEAVALVDALDASLWSQA